MQSRSTEDLFSISSVLTLDLKISKKQKNELKEIYKVFDIQLLNQTEELNKNIIWMHTDDIHKLEGTDYVRIANYAYKVGVKNIIPGAICINSKQKNEIEKSISKSQHGTESVILRSINLKNQHYKLKSIVLKVEFLNILKGQYHYDSNKLQKLCAKKIVGLVVNQGQIFKIKSKNKISISAKELVSQGSEKNELPFGFVTNETKIILENANSDKITLVNPLKDNILEYCEFAIFKKKSTLNSQVEVNETTYFIKENESTIIGVDKITDGIFKKYNENPLFEDLKAEFDIENQTFEIILTEMKSTQPIIARQYKTGLFLNSHVNFDFISYNNDLIITTNNTKYIADLCSFKIKGVWNARKNQLSGQRLQPWVNLEELEKEIASKKEFAIGQNFKVKLSNGIFLVCFECAENYIKNTTLLETQGTVKSIWSLNYDSKITYTAEPYLNLKLIPNNFTSNISSVCFEVTPHSDLKCFLITDKNDIDEVLEVDLIEALNKEIKYPIVESQTIEVTVRGITYVLKAKNIEFAKKESLNEVDSLGILTKETKFKFNPVPDNPVNIIAQKGNIDVAKLKETLKEIGLGGIEAKLDKLIQEVMIGQDSEFKVYGTKPVKGIILYGPPGTGKTTLARNISKFLGCDKQRLTLMSGPEILQKYVGESERMIRELFDEAKASQDKYGDKSPLYTIVFDEFDAIASKRGESKSEWHNSTVDQLLAMVDGLLKLNNILVIGITNNFESIDSAIKRPGRFEFHMEMGLPDDAGRIEILEIYTRKLRANNLLAKDVDLSNLSDLIAGYSGADIEALVNKAATYPPMRLLKFRNLSDEEKIEFIVKRIPKFEDLSEQEKKERAEKEIANLKLVSFEDFRQVHLEMDKTRDKTEKRPIPFGMYG